MAISATNLTSGSDTDGNSTASTASVSPSSNKLQLLSVSSRTGITADPNQPTATGNGLTWVVVNSIVYDTTSSSRRRITVLRAMGASPSSGAIAIDFGGQNQTAVDWVLDEYTGMDTSGTNGSGAIVQSATNKDESGTATSLTVTLSAFGSTANATYGTFSADVSGTYVAGTGFIISAQLNASTTDLSIATEFRNDNDTTVNITDASGWGSVGGIAVEIKIATFGYTTDGSSFDDLTDLVLVNGVLSESGSVTKLTFRGNYVTSAVNIKGLIYSDNGSNYPDALLGTTNITSVSSATETWFDATFSTPINLSAGTYWLGFAAEAGRVSIAYDGSQASYDSYERSTTFSYYTTPPDPLPAGATLRDQRAYSVYATYTVPVTTRLLGLLGVGS